MMVLIVLSILVFGAIEVCFNFCYFHCCNTHIERTFHSNRLLGPMDLILVEARLHVVELILERDSIAAQHLAHAVVGTLEVARIHALV